MLPNPISYLVSESLLSLRRFLDLWEAKSLLQFVQFLAQLGEQLFCWIGFFTCLLCGAEIGFHCPVFVLLVAIFGSMCSMHAPMFLAQLAGPLKTDFLCSLLRGSSTGPLGSCLVLVRAFSPDCKWAFLGVHTCLIVLREA